MTKNQKIIIVLAGVVLAGLILLYFSLKSDKPDLISEDGRLPTSTPSLITGKDFELIKMFPLPGENMVGLPNSVITFTFSTPVDVDTVELEITPDIEMNTFINENDESILYIRPATEWILGTNHQIKLNIKAKDGKKLGNTIEFDFLPTLITEIILDEEYF